MSLQHDGMSLDTFAHRSGIRKGQLKYYCEHGRIEGARFDRITWQWRIFPPARLLLGSRAAILELPEGRRVAELGSIRANRERQKASEAPTPSLLAEVVSIARPSGAATDSPRPGRAVPWIYSSPAVECCCRSIWAAAARQQNRRPA